MNQQRNSMAIWMPILLGILLLSAATTLAWSQAKPDFSGQWQQDNDRCQPKRTGDFSLHIVHHDPLLTVESTITRKDNPVRHALQKYTTDGKVSISTGADGDEFRTAVLWQDNSLLLAMDEHEDGRILVSKETWSLLDNGATLEMVRERPNAEKRILYFRRVAVSTADSKPGAVIAGDKPKLGDK